MKVASEFVHNLKELPSQEWLAPGSALCAGCGALATVRLMLKALGGDVVIVNAAGCLTLLATYPFTAVRSSWLYTTMGSAPAGAQGIRDALDILIARGRLPAQEDLKVLVVAGDGATLDIGLSSMSGAIHRGLDFYYLCYDNEAYGNTGFQMSSATPYGSRTATSPPTPLHRAGTVQSKKDLFALWLAHRPPYAATVSLADPLDLIDKVCRAGQVRGPRLFHALASCPPGWGYDPEASHRLAKLALDTGIWPLKEAVAGRVRHTYIPDQLHPVEEYLRCQRRYEHLFVPTRQEEVLATIQANINHYWQEVKQRELHRAD